MNCIKRVSVSVIALCSASMAMDGVISQPLGSLESLGVSRRQASSASACARESNFLPGLTGQRSTEGQSAIPLPWPGFQDNTSLSLSAHVPLPTEAQISRGPQASAVPLWVAEATVTELHLDRYPLSVEQLSEALPRIATCSRAYLWIGPCSLKDVAPLALYPSIIKLNLHQSLSSEDFQDFWKIANSDEAFKNLESLDVSGPELPSQMSLASLHPKTFANLKDLKLTGRGLVNATAWIQRFGTTFPIALETGPEAWVVLGYACETGWHMPQDFSLALALYSRSTSALGTFMRAQLLDSWSEAPQWVGQDTDQALAAYGQAADQGYGPAQTQLGFMKAHGRGIARDKHQAVALYKEAAAQGYAPAQALLGYMYEYGQGGLDPDLAQARHFYEAAAAQADPRELIGLGGLYEEGKAGLAKDPIQAAKLYTQAAQHLQQRHGVSAWTSLGWLYAEGHAGLPQGDEANQQAVALWRKAANQGYARAQFNLGVMYDDGQGVEQSDTEAIAWYSKAAEQNYAPAQFNLGVMYKKGRGVTQSDKEAASWYRKAADQGDADAQFNLGVMYDKGRGVPKSDTEAASWYRKAAEQNHAPAQYFLGWKYFTGCGVPKSDTETVDWWRKAAEQGHADAQYNLGKMYSKGCGVPKSDTEAITWYRRAADKNNAQAQFYLGWMYAKGLGAPQSHVEAANWYRKAAEQGHADAQNSLGVMYKKGRGVPKSDTEAITWFRKATDKNHAAAQYNLGGMYHEGCGISQDTQEALRWYRSAVDQNYTRATKKLTALYQQGYGIPRTSRDLPLRYIDKNFQEILPQYQQAAAAKYAATHPVYEADATSSEPSGNTVPGSTSPGSWNVDSLYYVARSHHLATDGFLEDKSMAAALYERAVDQGHIEAAYYLARLYLGGDVSGRSMVDVALWLKVAADKDHLGALKDLGWMYREGCGVAQDACAAFELYRRAAAREDAEACYVVGLMYENGDGVTRDTNQAAAYYAQAAPLGHRGAQFNLRMRQEQVGG